MAPPFIFGLSVGEQATIDAFAKAVFSLQPGNEGVAQGGGLAELDKDLTFRAGRILCTEPGLAHFVRQFGPLPPADRLALLIGDPYGEGRKVFFPGDSAQKEAEHGELRALFRFEPAGRFDTEFSVLDPAKPGGLREQQRAKLCAEVIEGAKMGARLWSHIENEAEKLWTLPAKEIFSQLMQVAFDTTDPQQIAAEHSFTLRNWARCSIGKIIESIEELRPYRGRFAADPKTVVEEIFKEKLEGRKLSGPIYVEVLPVGVMIHAAAEDFGLLASDEKAHTLGVFLHQAEIPGIFWGRTMLVRCEKGELSVVDPVTREHELSHLVFSQFFSELRGITALLGSEEARCISVMAHVEGIIQQRGTELRRSSLTTAKDEAIAYHIDGSKSVPLSSLAAERFRDALRCAAARAHKGETQDPKQFTFAEVREEYRRFLDQLAAYRLAANILMVDSKSERPKLSSREVQILLFLTPIEKVERLLSHLPYEVENLEQYRKSEGIENSAGLKKFWQIEQKISFLRDLKKNADLSEGRLRAALDTVEALLKDWITADDFLPDWASNCLNRYLNCVIGNPSEGLHIKPGYDGPERGQFEGAMLLFVSEIAYTMQLEALPTVLDIISSSHGSYAMKYRALCALDILLDRYFEEVQDRDLEGIRDALSGEELKDKSLSRLATEISGRLIEYTSWIEKGLVKRREI